MLHSEINPLTITLPKEEALALIRKEVARLALATTHPDPDEAEEAKVDHHAAAEFLKAAEGAIDMDLVLTVEVRDPDPYTYFRVALTPQHLLS